jgi:hypothetical protein
MESPDWTIQDVGTVQDSEIHTESRSVFRGSAFYALGLIFEKTCSESGVDVCQIEEALAEILGPAHGHGHGHGHGVFILTTHPKGKHRP